MHKLLDAVVYGAAPDERDMLFSGAAPLAAGLLSDEQAPRDDDTEVFRRLHGLPAPHLSRSPREPHA